jgi:glycosyltransferase involved in cell wall biosynthesis
MTILVLVPFSFYQQSGSSLSTYYRIMALLDLGYDIDIITYPHGNNLPDEKLNILRSPGRKLFSSFQPGEYKKKIVYDFFILTKCVRQLIKKKYDVVIVHGTMTYWIALIKAFFKPHFIAMKHGNLDVEVAKWGISNKKWIIRLARGIDVWFTNRYKKIICEHHSVMDKFLEAGIQKHKLSLIRIAIISSPTLNADKNTSRPFQILYAGTFVKVQNIELLYKTAELLKNENVVFNIIGAVGIELEEGLKIINSMGISDHVKIIERKPQSELKNYFLNSDIVVSPRVFGHDTPMKIFDYLNFGKCILATDEPIHTEILNKRNAYLTDGTPDSFANAILDLKHHPDLITKLGSQAKTDFTKKYGFDQMVHKYKELIESIDH